MIRLLSPSVRTSLGLACLLSSAPAVSGQVTVAFTPDIDTSIYSESGDLGNAQGLFLFMGRTGQGNSRRALLRFDVSSIPAGATIVAADLTVNMNQSAPGINLATFHAYRLLEQWDEGASQAAGGEGMGGAAMTGDATWSDRLYPACDWTSPGGAFDATSSGSVMIADITGFHTFVGPGIAADVQSWIDGAEPNHGWILAVEASAGPSTAKRLASSEYPSPVDYPTLNVTYTAGAGSGALNYCGPAVLNSSGCAASIWWSGSLTIADANFSITADGLPAGQFGYFITSQTQGYFMPAASDGYVCVGSNIGRFNYPGGIISGPSGSVTLDLGAFPTNPPVAVQAGDTWNFQCWYRDVGNTNNFSNGLQVTFD